MYKKGGIKLKSNTPDEIIEILKSNPYKGDLENGEKLVEFLLEHSWFKDRFYLTQLEYQWRLACCQGNGIIKYHDFFELIKPYISSRKKKKCLFVLSLDGSQYNYYLYTKAQVDKIDSFTNKKYFIYDKNIRVFKYTPRKVARTIKTEIISEV